MKKTLMVMGAMALSGASMYGGYMLASGSKKKKKKLPVSLGTNN